MTVTYHSGERIQGTQADFDGTPAVAGGWKELDRTTLNSGAASTIDVSSIPDKRYYMVLLDFPRSGTSQCGLKFNNVSTGSEYSRRYNYNYGSDSAPNGEAYMDFTGNGSSTNNFAVFFIANKTDAEKLVIMYGHEQGTSGDTAIGDARNQIGKWNNVSSAINRITAIVSANNYAQGAEMVVLGYDPDDTHTDNFWELLDDSSWSSGDNWTSGTFTAKKYLWVQIYDKAGSGSTYVRFNGSNATDYCNRYSINGGASTITDQPESYLGAMDNFSFHNLFILNNASKEKLFVHNRASVSSANNTAIAPTRMESIGKWANTSNAITSISVLTAGGGNLTAGNMKVWGSN
jgi:hypothetical protein